MTKRNTARIALIGNMNNNHFALIRYLRDLGYDASLFIFKTEQEHFRPYNDSFSLDYQEYTHYIDWSRMNFGRTDQESITKELEGYNFVICQGVAPAFLHKANIRIDMFCPFGGDLYELPYSRRRSLTKSVYKKYKHFIKTGKFQTDEEQFARSQRDGIKSAIRIVLFNTEWGSEIIKLGVQGKWAKIPIPMIYSELYNSEVIENYHQQSHWFKEIERIKGNFNYLFLSHSRHYWKEHKGGVKDKLSNKGNEKLIRGFADFLSKSDKDACLIMLEYGLDVLASKELVMELGIEDNVIWFPKMPRKEIMILINHADLVCNEFNNSWIGGGVIFETISMGKPLMGYRNDDAYVSRFDELYPMINARAQEEICQGFEDYVRDQDKYLEMGNLGKSWYEKNIVKKSLQFFSEQIEKAFN